MTLAKCQILKRRKMRENASILTTSQVENKKGTRRLSQIGHYVTLHNYLCISANSI